MNWLDGMNRVVRHIEENLTEPISYSALAKIVGCSAFEFSRIFPFLAGVTISEYIRRRRLSQAAFEIQNTRGKIIDIGLKWGYESPTTFTRAFKELHGIPPMAARKHSVPLKTYPPISFVLTLKGVNAMTFRIEKKGCFKIMGLAGKMDHGIASELPDGENSLGRMWDNFMDNYNLRLWNNGSPSYYTAPFWQVGAFSYRPEKNMAEGIIGAECKGEALEGMDVKEVPAATWAAFTFTGPTGPPVGEAFTRIFTEWLPQSGYQRDENAPTLEIFPDGDASSQEYKWEIWLPVKGKDA